MKKVFHYLSELKNRKNTVVIVEHSSFFVENCDELIVMGPGAGEKGGEVVWQGKPKKTKKKQNKSADVWATDRRILDVF